MVDVFVSYYHDGDQNYKIALDELNTRHRIFADKSVRVGDIDDVGLDDQQIRRVIRDQYLVDSTVTVVLCGAGTAGRKHVDWEIFSSMYDGPVNKQSGVLAILLPPTETNYVCAGHGDIEKKSIYPNITSWGSLTRRDYEERYPRLPARIIDNLAKGSAKISVVNWSLVQSYPEALRLLIQLTHDDRGSCDYDLAAPMRRNNS